MTATKASTLLLFGATGDLAHRMLLPSLYGLHVDGLLPADLKVLGTARTEMDDAGFRAMALKALADFVPADFYDEAKAKAFTERLGYVALDATQDAISIRWQAGSIRPRASPSSCRPRRRCSNRSSPASNASA